MCQGKLVKDRFENFNIVNKFDGIVMNPPFGKGGKTAIEHLAKAAKHLRDGGRIIAILPDGPAANKRFDVWYEQKENKNIYKVADIKLPDVAFERAGTKVRARIVILDKVSEGAVPPVSNIEIQAQNIKDFFNKIENLPAPERTRVSISEQALRWLKEEKGLKIEQGEYKPEQSK